MKIRAILGGLFVLCASAAQADVMQYGDKNLLGTGTYPSEPTAGATLQGLAPDVVTAAANSFQHPFPFQPAPGAFSGTDQIYTGGSAGATGASDAYSASPQAIPGPQNLSLNYASLVPAGQAVDTVTLGLAADDFQKIGTGQPYTATINGMVNAALSNELNSLNIGGPKVQYFTVGLNPPDLGTSNILNVSISRASATGADGWAVDFATVGVTTHAVPEPSTLCVMALGACALAMRRSLRRRPA